MAKKAEDVVAPAGFDETLAEFGYSLPSSLSQEKTQLNLTLNEKREWNKIVGSPLFKRVLLVTNQMKPSVFGNSGDTEIRNQLAGWQTSQFALLTAGVVKRKKKKKQPKQEYQETE